MFTDIIGYTALMSDKPVGAKHSEKSNTTGLKNINKNAAPLPSSDEEKIK